MRQSLRSMALPAACIMQPPPPPLHSVRNSAPACPRHHHDHRIKQVGSPGALHASIGPTVRSASWHGQSAAQLKAMKIGWVRLRRRDATSAPSELVWRLQVLGLWKDLLVGRDLLSSSIAKGQMCLADATPVGISEGLGKSCPTRSTRQGTGHPFRSQVLKFASVARRQRASKLPELVCLRPKRVATSRRGCFRQGLWHG